MLNQNHFCSEEYLQYTSYLFMHYIMYVILNKLWERLVSGSSALTVSDVPLLCSILKAKSTPSSEGQFMDTWSDPCREGAQTDYRQVHILHNSSSEK